MEKLLAISVPGYGNLSIDAPQASSGVDINTIFRFSVELLVVAGIVAALIYLLLAGIRWITSGGDKEKVEGARKGITYSIIGLVIILISFLIINLIGQIFGVGNLQMFGVTRNEQHRPEPEELPLPQNPPPPSQR